MAGHTAVNEARSLEDIEAEMARVKDEMNDVHGTECGVYARITGYYRPLRNWNKGKEEEYKLRKLYKFKEDAK